MRFLKQFRLKYREWRKEKYFLNHETNIQLKNNLNALRKETNRSVLRILGNGSSLNEVLDNLESDAADYLVVNRYVLSETYAQIKPKYYVLADPHFFSKEEGLSVLEKICETTTWNIKLFIPSARSFDEFVPDLDQKVDKIFGAKKYIDIVFYNACEYTGPEKLRFEAYEQNLAMPRVENVLIPSIFIGLSIRYPIIELYGVEHSWTKYLFVNEKNETCISFPSFYKKEQSEYTVLNDTSHKSRKLHDILHGYAWAFESYWQLQRLADCFNISIVNCTKDSFIDAFKRK